MLIITGNLYVTPTDLSQFLADFHVLSLATRQREGNISYDAGIDDQRAGRLILLERWTDQRALSAHLGSVDTAQFIRKWQGRMHGDIRKYEVFNERELMQA